LFTSGWCLKINGSGEEKEQKWEQTTLSPSYPVRLNITLGHSMTQK
jgi:hypothetical protein